MANLKFHADDLIKKYKKKTAKPDELASTPEKKASWNNHLGSVTHIRLLMNEQILSTSSDGKFTLWRGPEGGISREWMGESKKLLVVDQDQYLVCVSHGNFGSEPGYAKIYDMGKAEWTCMYKGHELYITDIAQNGGWVATSSADSTVRLWDFAPQENEMHMASDWLEMQVKTPKFTLRHKDQVNVVMYIGNLLYSASADKTIISWNPNATQNKVFTGHTGSVNAICGLPQHNLLFSASSDLTLRTWNTQTAQCLSVLKLKYAFASIMIHKDVLYGWTDGPKFYIAAIDLKSANYIKYKGPTKKITCVRFSSECMFVSSADGRFWQWDLEPARCVTAITVPANRDGVGTFLVHKQQVFLGTERIIHSFPLMDDNEIRATRVHRAAALAQAMSKRSLSKASGADARSASPIGKDLRKDEKKSSSGSGKNITSTPPPASPSTPKTSSGSPAPTRQKTSQATPSPGFDPLEERYGTQSSFDKVNPAVNELVLKTKAERERKEAAEREHKRGSTAASPLSPSSSSSSNGNRSASMSASSSTTAFSAAAVSSGTNVGTTAASKTSAIGATRGNASPQRAEDDEGSDRSERSSSNPAKKKTVAEKLLFERKNSSTSASPTSAVAPVSALPSASPTTAKLNASSSAKGSGSPTVASAAFHPSSAFPSAAATGPSKRNSSSGLTLIGPPPSTPPPPTPPPPAAPQEGTGPAVLTGSGPVITYTAISKVYSQPPPLLSGQKEKTPPTPSPLNSSSKQLHSSGSKSNPEVFAPIPPPSPTSSSAAAHATSSPHAAAQSQPQPSAAGKPKITPTTPIEVFMNMLLPEMKNFEEGKMEQIISHLKEEAIVEVQDLMLLQDEHYRELKVPLGLALRIKGKIKELPPM